MSSKFRSLRKRLKREHKASLSTFRRVQRHPIMVPILTFFALSVVSTAGILLVNNGTPKFHPIGAYIVIISHDHISQTVPTLEPSVGALLTKLAIKINAGDVVEPSTNTPITQDNFHINIYRAVPVEIISGSQKTYTFSAATTPRSIVQQAKLPIYAEDYVSSKPVANFATQVSISKQVIIDPATPVNLNLYGTPLIIRTHTTTVGAMLKEKQIKLASGDSVQPDMSTPISANVQVFLIHQGTKIETIQQSIPMPIQKVLDPSLTFGTTAIRQQGSPGIEAITYSEITQNNVVISRTAIQTVITQQPVTEIIAEGQAVQIPSDKEAVMAQAGISSSDYAYVNYIVSNESGWCPTKLQGQIGYCPGYAPSYIPSNLGYGLGQATPGNKMAPFGSDWETNPVTQLRWATSYASKYGGWAGAYDFWFNHHYW